jgi:iron complex outermembrane receptor protein
LIVWHPADTLQQQGFFNPTIIKGVSAMVRIAKRNGPSTRFSELLFASAAAVSLFGVPALAQTATADKAETAQSGGVEEIVVTARKRSEDLQTTPVSITAISGAEVEELSIRNFQDLRGFIPNLNITPMTGGIGGQVPGAVNLTIRGIGQGSNQVNVDPGVGLYINDLYIARSDGNEYGFFDLDSTQVLKGPQGTLFGKNTLGGAVLVTTKLPTDSYGGYLDFRVGNYNTINAEGALNIPLTDKVSARISFRTDNADGYIKHTLNSGTSDGLNDQTVRFQVRAKPITANRTRTAPPRSRRCATTTPSTRKITTPFTRCRIAPYTARSTWDIIRSRAARR